MIKHSLDKKATQYIILLALETFEKDKKKDPDYQSNSDLKDNVKTLFGLITHGNFDINNLSLSLINTLYIVLDYQEKIISSDLELNEMVMDVLVERIEDAIKPKEEKSFALSDEELIKKLLVHNKKLLVDENINSYERRLIYQEIDSWFLNNTVPSNYMKEVEIEVSSRKITFKAKLGEKDEHIYKIIKIVKC